MPFAVLALLPLGALRPTFLSHISASPSASGNKDLSGERSSPTAVRRVVK
ncbi:hypothetical protein PC116_g20984 [Phytophthora cactorum]|nr:hypothetical protein C6341_g1948 [Phytophthora cactorum]KAG4230730.1 hypothetical protein PC116_g20984 [Phytophthora cactorum]